MKLYVNEAIHEKTKRIHAAHELSSLPYATDGRWLCVDEDCGVEMIPCAWQIKDPPHKVAPYFRQKHPHKACCSVSGLATLSATSRKARVQTEQEFPLPYPSKVLFEEKRHLTEAASRGANRPPIEHVARPRGPTSDPSRPEHHRTVRSIRAGCEFYATIPYDLDLPLEVPGCRGTTFEEIFLRLGSATEPDPDTQYILYDQVMFTKRWVRRGDVLTLTLLSSITLPDGSKRPRKVHLNLSGCGAHRIANTSYSSSRRRSTTRAWRTMHEGRAKARRTCGLGCSSSARSLLLTPPTTGAARRGNA